MLVRDFFPDGDIIFPASCGISLTFGSLLLFVCQRFLTGIFFPESYHLLSGELYWTERSMVLGANWRLANAKSCMVHENNLDAACMDEGQISISSFVLRTQRAV